MAGIKDYSTTAANNNASPPNGFPEGMAPASLNDSARQVMADIRSWYENPVWIDFGHTATYVTGTTFTIASNVTSTYVANRRIRAIGTTPFTIYGTITGSSYSAPNTTVTVVWDSGSLNATLSQVALNMLTGSDNPFKGELISEAGGTLSGALNTADYVTVASATNPAIGAANSNNIYITGTTTIEGFDSVASGIIRLVKFESALTLTHDATSFILPSGVDITTAADDMAFFISEGSGNWRCVSYHKASGLPVVDKVVQRVYASSASVTTTITPIPNDDTIPQNTEGAEILTASITPKKSTNRLKIEIEANMSHGTESGSYGFLCLFQDSTADALACSSVAMPTAAGFAHPTLIFEMNAGTTSLTTFKVRAGFVNPGTVTFNGVLGSRRLGGKLEHRMIITEYTS